MYPIKPNGAQGLFLGKGDSLMLPLGDNARTYDLQWTPDNMLTFTVHFEFPVGAADTNRPGGAILSVPAQEGRWIHVAGVYSTNDSGLQVFTNGVLAAATTTASGNSFKGFRLRQHDRPLYFGYCPPYAVFPKGQMDDVRIWSKARSGDEIQRDFQCILSGGEPNLVGYWTFDDGTAKDLTGNGHNGTLMGNAQIIPISADDGVHGGCPQARTVAIQVPGSADPWLAGMPDRTVASATDHAPAQSPAEVSGLTVLPGVTLTFHVTGSVSRGPDFPLTLPDGDTAITSHLPPIGAENGISDISAPFECLVGVFLSAGQPDQHVAPQPLDFSSAASRSFSVLTPAPQQVFFIGDGLNSAGAAQQFIVPVGASRLFLGTLDRDGYYNNLGSFTVEVHGTPTLGIVMYPGLWLEGTVGATYRIDFITDLSGATDWTTLTSIVLPTSPFLILDTNAPTPRRFYRAIQQP